MTPSTSHSQEPASSTGTLKARKHIAQLRETVTGSDAPQTTPSQTHILHWIHTSADHTTQPNHVAHKCSPSSTTRAPPPPPTHPPTPTTHTHTHTQMSRTQKPTAHRQWMQSVWTNTHTLVQEPHTHTHTHHSTHTRIPALTTVARSCENPYTFSRLVWRCSSMSTNCVCSLYFVWLNLRQTR